MKISNDLFSVLKFDSFQISSMTRPFGARTAHIIRAEHFDLGVTTIHRMVETTFFYRAVSVALSNSVLPRSEASLAIRETKFMMHFLPKIYLFLILNNKGKMPSFTATLFDPLLGLTGFFTTLNLACAKPKTINISSFS
jgi:hypothetical protein